MQHINVVRPEPNVTSFPFAFVAPSASQRLHLCPNAASTQQNVKNWGKSFYRHLNGHYLKHTGEKPYKCQFPGCSYIAARQQTLSVHYRTHTGEKPFKCQFPGCSYAAKTQRHVDNHYHTHTGEKPCKCQFPGCSYAAVKQWHVNRHYLLRHK